MSGDGASGISLDERHLQSLERWTIGLALVVIAAAAVATSRMTLFGVSVGAGLMVANSVVIRSVGSRVIRAAKGTALLLLNFKMVALMGLVYVAVRLLAVDTLGFIIGVSVFPAAVVATALSGSLSSDSAAHEPQPRDDAATQETLPHG